MSGGRRFGMRGVPITGLTSLGWGATLRRSSVHVIVLRLVALAAPFVVLGSTMAAHGAIQPVACLVFGPLALAGALSRDSHVGMLTMLLLGLNWVQTIDDSTTPWVMVAAAGMVMLHASLAAITVAPPAARWRADRVRVWVRRSIAAFAVAIPAWLASVVLVDQAWAGSTVLLTAALASFAAGAAWLRLGSVRR